MGWARGKASSFGAQAVLSLLADRANEHGITWVGQATLARDAVCSETHVRRSLAVLEQQGLVARVRRHGHRGYRTSDFTVLAPLAIDREGMLDVEDQDVSNGRYPEDVAVLARECDDREFAERELDLAHSLHGRTDVLTATQTAPTDQPAPAYPPDESSLAHSLHGEALSESSYEALSQKPPAARQQQGATATALTDSVRQAVDQDSGAPGALAAAANEGDGGGGQEDQKPAEEEAEETGAVFLSDPRWRRKQNMWQGELALASSLGVDVSDVVEMPVERYACRVPG